MRELRKTNALINILEPVAKRKTDYKLIFNNLLTIKKFFNYEG